MRRRPDIEAANLFAVDAADRLILDVAADALASPPSPKIAVVDDNYGALTLGAAVLSETSEIRVLQDHLTGERALDENAREAGLAERYTRAVSTAELLAGADVVLMRLPRGLAELAETADAIARHAAPQVRVFAGGRDKHITPAMNDVLGRSFEVVTPSRGRQKSRVLVVSGPREVGPSAYPVQASIPELNLQVVAHGAVFAGAKLDLGTRFLLTFLPRMRAAADAIDLGCGTGILAVELARQRPDLRVVATDESVAAVASAAATAAANGVADRVVVVRDDALGSFADASADLIVCNPPFHIGASVHTGGAEKMFRDAGRVLRPGGEMWTVFNTHLNYRGLLARFVGATENVGRNQKFTVARSTRRIEAKPDR
ncbi:class I SAM-dependent methyltransferase [Antrihabitans sp. YC2-6]|uniref:class I SAM-dependent methyltransferase n=1 Tax=Antrihabitans sp. YC2-6 TaxID=2799498 RepID=UPI0018F41119|nr:methyltransferase [Antrihabitans sp. YC2-6]MBJ8343783.1 methyltransferase [Antrihabitans sp. YC2-6]